MLTFRIQGNKLDRVREIQFIEKDLQTTVESNLEALFGLQFVATELVVGSLRLDTLAFDSQAKSFVIIEYKKDRNLSVIDQGYAYLSTLLNNKAEFVLEFNEHSKGGLKRDDVDWTQTKVVFISPEFTKYQRQAIAFKDLPIELWEVKKFDNSTITFNQLVSPEMAESIATVSGKSELVKRVSREVKVYVEEDHLHEMPESIKELYQELKERVLALGVGIRAHPVKFYIGFVANTDFTDFVLLKSKIVVSLNMKVGTVDDPKGIAKDVSKKGHWTNGDYVIDVVKGDDLDYVMTLVRQSYIKHSK